MYEKSFVYNKDGTLDRIEVTPIRVIRKSILPGCSAESISFVDSNGFHGCGSEKMFCYTEEQAWVSAYGDLTESIYKTEELMTKLEEQLKQYKKVLKNIDASITRLNQRVIDK